MNEYNLEGMKCQSCVGKITDAFSKAGYRNVSVTLNPPKLSFSSDRTISDEDVQRTLSNAGDYKITPSLPSTAPLNNTDADERLTPLFIILSYIVGGVLLRASLSNEFSSAVLMTNFMGGFLVIFSMFKLLNLSGFAEAYATYDVIASRSRTYGLAYPFIELALGVTYLVGFQPFAVNLVTFILMVIGSVGVYQALKTKRKFQCACLGTALKLPMTKVTLVEDVTMGVMALIMLIHSLEA
jgi:copper chaperone CopZ